ncbi:MAG: hypothetical protein ACQEWA_03190 [Sphaerochaetaceae bacterium]
MLYEISRAPFGADGVDLTEVGASSTYNGADIDFDAEGQMIETNEVLEVFLTEDAASSGSPTLQVIVETKEEGGAYSQIAAGQVFALANLKEDTVIYKSALPEGCGQYIRVSLVNGAAATFTAGAVAGVIRPLSVV